jgi:hypothetical protein
MRKYQEELFTAAMDFQISASPYGNFEDDDFQYEDDGFDEDDPLPEVEYPSNCPNCGDQIVHYQTPSPFRSGGLLVGVFIASRYYLCRHCLTDREMIGHLPIWSRVVELREARRKEKFDHLEFLKRELLLLESEVSVIPVPEAVTAEVMGYVQSQRDKPEGSEQSSHVQFSSDGPYKHLRLTPWPFIRPLSLDSPHDRNAVNLDDVVRNWDPATQTTTLRVPFEKLIAQLNVAAIGPTTAMWYRAHTIRYLIDNPQRLTEAQLAALMRNTLKELGDRKPDLD